MIAILASHLFLGGIVLAGELPSVDEPLKTQQRVPGEAAVVVGIENYRELLPVNYAERDARAFARFLIDTRGLSSTYVHDLYGASREDMLEALRQAAQDAGPGGTTWFYYSGHGVADIATGEQLILGEDVPNLPKRFAQRGVSISEIRDAIIPEGGNAIVILDACYGGAGRTGEPLVEGYHYVAARETWQPPSNFLLWTAVKENELAGPLDEARHGAFTFFVLGALRGWADQGSHGDGDGIVTALEASDYVRDALREIQVVAQTPQLQVPQPDAWELAREVNEEQPNLSGLRHSQTTTVLSSLAMAVQNSQIKVAEDWATVLGVWQYSANGNKDAVRRFIEKHGDTTVTVGEDTVPVELPEIALAKSLLDTGRLKAGTLEVESTPSKALVEIDGFPKGHTPQVLSP